MRAIEVTLSSEINNDIDETVHIYIFFFLFDFFVKKKGFFFEIFSKFYLARGSPPTNIYLREKPKMSVFKNGQFRCLFFCEKKIV
jgi:hypothetical protein